MENYSAIKRKEILTYATKWMDLEDIHKISQTEKGNYCIISLIYGM